MKRHFENYWPAIFCRFGGIRTSRRCTRWAFGIRRRYCKVLRYGLGLVQTVQMLSMECQIMVATSYLIDTFIITCVSFGVNFSASENPLNDFGKFNEKLKHYNVTFTGFNRASFQHQSEFDNDLGGYFLNGPVAKDDPGNLLHKILISSVNFPMYR